MTPHFTQGRSLSHPDGLQCDPGLCTPCPHCCLLLSLYLLHFSQAHSLLGALVLSVPMAGRALPPRHLLDQLLLFSVVPTSTLYLKICPPPPQPTLSCVISLLFFFPKITLHILTAYHVTYLSCLLLAKLQGMWDPSSLTRIRTHAPCSGSSEFLFMICLRFCCVSSRRTGALFCSQTRATTSGT